MTVFAPTSAPESTPRRVARIGLGSAMAFAGIGHLTFVRDDFRAQVPEFAVRFSPLSEDAIVLASGVVEIGFGAATILLTSRRAAVGLILALFFVAIFPGNLAQWRHRRDAFGLTSDRARIVRLVFQPVLVAWALWSSGAWDALRA